MVACDEFQDAINLPIGPTNTFVLVRKRDVNQLSNFFIPKPQYSFPLQASSFHIRIDHSKNIQMNCRCSSAVKIFHDSKSDYHMENENLNSSNQSSSCNSSSYQWYQARNVIKGFKFFR